MLDLFVGFALGLCAGLYVCCVVLQRTLRSVDAMIIGRD